MSRLNVKSVYTYVDDGERWNVLPIEYSILCMRIIKEKSDRRIKHEQNSVKKKRMDKKRNIFF